MADFLVVPALLVVLVIVVVELFFTEIAHHYDVWINMADTAVIAVFAIDLSFKWRRATEWEGFVRKHWLEIIAITPFFYVFRVFELVWVASTAEIGQETAHLAEGARSGRLTQFFRSAEATRSARFGRFIRFFSRAPRFAKAAEFFKHPGED